MKFAQIIREAGLNPSDYPRLSEIPIKLSDRKNRLIEDETIHFTLPLFEKKKSSLEHFIAFLDKNEAMPTFSSLEGKIDEAFLLLWIGESGLPIQFRR